MNEVKKVGRPKNSTRSRLAVSEEDFESLMLYVDQQVIKYTTAKKLRKAFTLLRLTGMRRSELLQVNYGMIMDGVGMGEDGVGGRFSLNNSTKTKSTRLILITEKGKEDLINLFGNELKTKNREDKIFKKWNGQELKPQPFTKLLNVHIKRCLGPLFVSHSFRQAYVTDMLKKNISPNLVCKLVGHKRVATTFLYSSVSEDDLMNALEQVR
jgi:site-specific recombinase XerD